MSDSDHDASSEPDEDVNVSYDRITQHYSNASDSSNYEAPGIGTDHSGQAQSNEETLNFDETENVPKVIEFFLDGYVD